MGVFNSLGVFHSLCVFNFLGVFNSLGVLYWSRDMPDKAEQAYRSAIDVRKKHEATFPFSYQNRVGLAGSMINLSNVKRARGEVKVAIELYGPAIHLLEDLPQT